MGNLTHLASWFWAQVERARPWECWEWQAGVSDCGYGRFSLDHKKVLAHRRAFELFHGRAPREDLCVLHSCDNRRCCNPMHLREGTNTDNVADRVSRGRTYCGGPDNLRPSPGILNGRAKLTEEQVYEILRLSKDGYNNTEISRMYNVANQLISRIVSGQCWKHLPRKAVWTVKKH